MGRTRILLADDHTMICAGLAKLLEPHYEVVGCVEDGRALLKAADQLKPDVVVLDIGMPLLNGLDAARALKKTTPHIKLIFLTMEADSYIAAEAFRAGAVAYLLKTSLPTELLQAVRDAVKCVVPARSPERTIRAAGVKTPVRPAHPGFPVSSRQ